MRSLVEEMTPGCVVQLLPTLYDPISRSLHMPDVSGPPFRNPLLEAQIAAEPDSLEPYLVYADWLIERGDPRGDWIRLQIVADAETAEDAWLVKHGAALVGPIAAWMRSPADPRPFTWFRGFIREAQLVGGFPIADAVRAFLDGPSAVALHALDMCEECARGPQPEALMEVVATRAPRSVQRVEFQSLGASRAPRDPAVWSELLAERNISVLTWRGLQAEEVHALAHADGIGSVRTLTVARLHDRDATAWWESVHALVQHMPALVQLYAGPETEPLQHIARNHPTLRVGPVTPLWRYRTIRHVRALLPGEHVECPFCGTVLNRLRVDRDRLICESCGRSFEPPAAVGGRLGIGA